MMEPLLPHPGRDETVAAADPGQGAPPPAEGTGPDVTDVMPDDGGGVPGEEATEEPTEG